MTAAGTLKAARFLILGVGVAGLQAIATAKRLGAVVEAFDIRPAVKEQVESLGARFVAHEAIQQAGETKGGYATELTPEQQARQREALGKHMAEADAIICSALVPGRKAPILLTTAQVASMRPGSVVVDLAADQGGNCELTKPGEIVNHGGVRVLGPLNVPSSVPLHASQMLSRNFQNFLLHLLKKGELQLDLADEVTAGALVTKDGAIVHPAVKSALGG
jgi:NAD(P) transhydrogenase subunit alpha